MIRKYLVCAKKNIYLQSRNMDSYESVGKVIELVLPIRKFWEIENLVKEANYLFASSETPLEIMRSYRNVLLKSATYAVYESDRKWLYGICKK